MTAVFIGRLGVNRGTVIADPIERHPELLVTGLGVIDIELTSIPLIFSWPLHPLVGLHR